MVKDISKTILQNGHQKGFRASVIVATYNRARLLERALRALAAQTAEPEMFEVVIVDDGSTDETEAVCARMCASMPNLRYLAFKRNRGANIAVREGIRIARGEFLLFTDDDCIPLRDWVDRMCAALDQAPIVAGMIASFFSDFVKLCHNISEFHPFLLGNKSRFVDFIAGANMGMRRNFYEVVGGFSKTNPMAHDMDIVLRARAKGYRILRAKDSVVVHDPDRDSLGTILQYASIHAENTILLRKKYRRVLKTPVVFKSPLLILLVSPFVSFWVTLGIYLRNPLNLFHWKTIPIVGATKMAWCWGAALGLSRSFKRKSLLAEKGR